MGKIDGKFKEMEAAHHRRSGAPGQSDNMKGL